MKRKKNEIKIEQGQANDEKRDLEYAKISFEFYLTKDEADKILNSPKSQIAKNARKYMNSILEHAAKKFFEPDSNVKDCKDSDKRD